MAIAVQTVANKVKLKSSRDVPFVARFTAGTGGTTAGYIVEMSSDGVIMCDGSDGGQPIGIALQTAVATATVDVMLSGGIVEGACTGATVGGAVYPTDGTAGAMTQSASTKKYSIGPAVSATAVLIRPIYIA